MESVSSSSQAKHGLASRRVRKKSKIVEVALLRSVSVNLAELRRVLEMKGTLLRSVSVDLVELRRVLEIKYFWFMDKIVTGGVGHLGG